MIYEWFQNIEFAEPRMLTLFAFLPVMIWWYFSKQRTNNATIKVTTAQSFNTGSFKTTFRHLPFFLRLLALACLILALARPQRMNVQEQRTGEGIDIVMSMDVSGSMLAQDFKPNRLEVSKELAVEFIQNRPIDRIGLVVFSGESYTLSPLTTDKYTLVTQIQGLKSGMLLDGTLIGHGLATAVDRLSESKAPSKVVILLSDGKEEAPKESTIDPLTALEIAKTRGVKVYTIGLGSQSYAAAPAENVGAQPSASRMLLDEELLRRIATETGGRYFRARDKNDLQNIYRLIDSLEKTEMEVKTKTRAEEKFLPLVIAALALLLLEILLRYTIFKKFP